MEHSEILNHLHGWKPTPKILRILQHERLLHQSDSVTDTELLSFKCENASSTILTDTRNAMLGINKLNLQNLFVHALHVGTIQMDIDDPLYEYLQGYACYHPSK